MGLRSILFSGSFYKGGSRGKEGFSNSPMSKGLFAPCLCNQNAYSPLSCCNFDFAVPWPGGGGSQEGKQQLQRRPALGLVPPNVIPTPPRLPAPQG